MTTTTSNRNGIITHWLKRSAIVCASAAALALMALPTPSHAAPQEAAGGARRQQQQASRSEPAADTPEGRVQRMAAQAQRLVTGGRVNNVQWSEDGSSVNFNRGRERFTFDLKAGKMAESPQTQPNAGDDQPPGPPGRRGGQNARGGQGGQGGRGGGAPPARGRQRDREVSPDGNWIAVCHEWNVSLEPGENNKAAHGPSGEGSPTAITTAGERKFRYGTASWVYGEELDQRDAMWWSPDSSKLAFYEFDERKVPDHFIAAGLTELHTHVLTEGYPKPGEPNPIANLCIYDVASKKTTRIDLPTDGEWYTYAVQWSPDGKSLLFNRTNRHQDELHVMAADAASGKTRVIVTENQKTWQANRPLMRFLKDGQRFIWETEKNGWKNYELRDLEGKLLATLTKNEYPVAGVEKIDETAGVLFYTAFSEKSCPLSAQLHRVNLDGTHEQRLTSEPQNHTSNDVSPDSKWFITTYEAVDAPPTSALYSAEGKRIAVLAEADRARFDELHLPMPELFTYKADDGTSDIYGVLFKPSDFDAKKKYPLVIDVYGGPESQSVRNRFTAVNPVCENGVLVARIDNRGTVNRGKAFESATYLRLGEKDIKDQADGVKFLEKRPYVDAQHVGIFGHSYGGYMSALGILKYPDVFQVAVAGSPVTDWKNYDTIYTERYMRTPEENSDGYQVGSCLKYAENLKGHLLIVHGMVDDNVHPNNTWQLIDLFEKADLPFDIMFYPNYDHGVGGNYNAVRWRYLRKWLIDEK